MSSGESDPSAADPAPDATDATAAPDPPGTPAPRASGWAPLRYPDYRRLWAAQFTSNIGSWMQTVAAQWAMTSLTSSALLLTAIPAAGSIPVLLLAVPAGTLGDLFDRRRLILVAQMTMLLAAAGLAVLSAAGALTAGVLLVLLFVIGIGGALGAPTWQTLQPELVPPGDRPQAIALGSVNQNLARAVGPAIGGLLLAATSAALVFSANALSFVAVLAAIVLTKIPMRKLTLPREHALAAARAGGRYVRSSPVLLALLVRSVAFVLLAGAIWAVLPLVARHRLGLGSGGYGLLLGCVGVGALAAATFGPALKARFAPKVMYAGACLVVAASALLLGLTHSVAVAVVALVASGAAWITGLGLMSTAYQSQLPSWVKARSFAYYLLAFQGANGIGSLCVGAIAQASSVSTALFVVAGGVTVAAAATWRLAMPGSGSEDAMLADPLPLPAVELDDTHTPVTVTVEYALTPGSPETFLAATAELRRFRRRTGATRWRLTRDAEDADLFIETFLAGSWEEHERQHERMQRSDQALLDRLDLLLRPGRPRAAHHAFGVRTSHGGGKAGPG
jgi:MFS family permease